MTRHSCTGHAYLALTLCLILPACVERNEDAPVSRAFESITDLDRFVLAEDPSYAYEHVRTLEGEGAWAQGAILRGWSNPLGWWHPRHMFSCMP